MIRFLRRPEVTSRYGLPRSTLYAWILAGRFPKPIRLGARSVGWSIDELDAWEQARRAERDEAAP